MKKLFPLVLLLMLAFTKVNAQAIPEKANTMVIATSDSATAVDKFTKLLTSKEYAIVKSKNPGLTTSAKTLKNNTRLVINVQFRGTEAWLTGSIVVAGQSNLKVEYKPGKGSPVQIAWEEMDKISKAYGSTVKYEKK